MPISLGFDVFVIAFVILIVITIALGVRTVPQGYAYTVERFGRYSRSLGPGPRTDHSVCGRHRQEGEHHGAGP